MRQTELVRVFNFNIAEGYYCDLDILENGQGDVIGKTMPRVHAELSTNQKPKS